MVITHTRASQRGRRERFIYLKYTSSYGCVGFPMRYNFATVTAILPCASTPTQSSRFPVSSGCAITFEPCNLPRSRSRPASLTSPITL